MHASWVIASILVRLLMVDYHILVIDDYNEKTKLCHVASRYIIVSQSNTFTQLLCNLSCVVWLMSQLS